MPISRKQFQPLTKPPLSERGDNFIPVIATLLWDRYSVDQESFERDYFREPIISAMRASSLDARQAAEVLHCLVMRERDEALRINRGRMGRNVSANNKGPAFRVT